MITNAMMSKVKKTIDDFEKADTKSNGIKTSELTVLNKKELFRYSFVKATVLKSSPER